MNDKINVEILPTPGVEKVLLQYQEPTEYIYRGVHYSLRSTQAVIDLIKKRGSQENTLIFYVDADKPQVQVVLDDKVVDRDKDIADYRFAKSDVLKEWEEVLGNPQGIDQKGFIKFLKRRKLEEFENSTMLQQLLAISQQLNLATVINFDSVYENENNKEVSFKIKDVDTSTTIPETFLLDIPLLNESDLKCVIDIELELVKPREEGQKARFVLSCPMLPKFMKEAVRYEIGKIREALPGYELLAGTGW